jgi:hypothetical protein
MTSKQEPAALFFVDGVIIRGTIEDVLLHGGTHVQQESVIILALISRASSSS